LLAQVIVSKYCDHQPIYRQIKDQMMSGPYIQVDETPIKYLDPGNGKTGQGYLWVAHRPGQDVRKRRKRRNQDVR
jgi:Transposase IS66 family